MKQVQNDNAEAWNNAAEQRLREILFAKINNIKTLCTAFIATLKNQRNLIKHLKRLFFKLFQISGLKIMFNLPILRLLLKSQNKK